MKKRSKIIVGILVAVIILIVSIIFIVRVYNKQDNTYKKPETVNKIKNYDYYLKSNSLPLYKTLFKELKKELEKIELDENKYVDLISKMFIIDFYTLDNKLDNLDIGGEIFLEESIKDNFKLKATDTIYKYVENNVYNDRTEKLPIVTEVIINKKDIVKFNDDLKAIKVNCMIKYKEDLKYPTNVTLTFIHKDRVLKLVEVK